MFSKSKRAKRRRGGRMVVRKVTPTTTTPLHSQTHEKENKGQRERGGGGGGGGVKRDKQFTLKKNKHQQGNTRCTHVLANSRRYICTQDIDSGNICSLLNVVNNYYSNVIGAHVVRGAE
jgi:hypothetical protein